MFTCAVCGTTIIDGSLCKKCGRLFCSDEETCIVCQKELVTMNVKSEMVYDYPIDWIIYENKKIGLVGYNILPRHLLLLLDAFIPNNIKIFFFSSKKLSKEFTDAVNKYIDIDPLQNIPFSEKSRYSVLSSPIDDDVRYLLFNTYAIKQDEFLFLFKFLTKTFSYVNMINEVDTSKIRETMNKILWEYNEKLGIPFIIYDDKIKLYINLAEKNIFTNYVEFISLLDVVTIDNLYLLFDHFSHKIELHYETLKSKNRFSILEVISTMMYYIYFTSVKVFTKKWSRVGLEISNQIYQNHVAFMEIIKNNSDLCSALEYIININDVDFSSFEKYANCGMTILEESMNMIKPLYDVPKETIQIFDFSELYQRNLRTGIELHHFKLGSPLEYATLLQDICRNDNANPTIRLMAGQSAAHILLECILTDFNYLIYIDFYNHSMYLSDLIVTLIPELNEKAKILELNKYIRYHDAADMLLVLMTMSETYEDNKGYCTAHRKLLDIIDKYELKPAHLMLLWKEYLKTHNVEKLKEIHKIFLTIDFNLYEYIEPITKVIGYLSFYVIDKNDREKHFNEAMEQIENLFSPEMNDVNRSLKNHILYNDLVNLFKIIIDATRCDDYINLLNKAKPYIYSIYDQSAPNEPIKSFAMKTEILIHFVNKNDELVLEKIDTLLTFQKSIYVEEFCNDIRYWLTNRKMMKGRLFAALKPKKIRDVDLWEEFLESYIEKFVLEDVENSIIASDIILLVEGETDEIVFNEFIKKVIPNKKVYLINSEGYNTLIVMKKELQIVNKFNIPIYSIFDGDTLNDPTKKSIRKKIEKLLHITQDRSYTLKNNSIENYLLIPRAIKSAFKDIILTEEEIAIKLKKGKNKKRSLDKLLKSENVGKYDKHKAKLIANNISIDEIDEEIKSILLQL